MCSFVKLMMRIKCHPKHMLVEELKLKLINFGTVCLIESMFRIFLFSEFLYRYR